MAVTQVGICNLALVRLGADRISSIDQSTRSAILLKAVWDIAVDSVLAAHPWHFAVKRAELTPTSETPAYEWDFTYDKPSDMLRALVTYPDDIDFYSEGNKILCDEDSLDIQYIYRNTDPSSWTPGFADALGWYLAKEIAYSLTQSLALEDFCDKKYMRVLAEARSTSGAEGTIQGLEAETWTLSRRG